MARVIHRFKWGGSEPSIGSQIGGALSGLGNLAKGIGSLLPDRGNPISLAIAQAFGQMAGGDQQQPGMAPGPSAARQPSIDALSYGVPDAAPPQAEAGPPAQATATPVPPATLAARRARLLQQLFETAGKAGADPTTLIQVATLIPDEQLTGDVRVVPLSRFPDVPPGMQDAVMVVDADGNATVHQPSAGRSPSGLIEWALGMCGEDIANCGFMEDAIQFEERLKLAGRAPGEGPKDDRPAQVRTLEWLAAQSPEMQQIYIQLARALGQQPQSEDMMTQFLACADQENIFGCIRDRLDAKTALGAIGSAVGSGASAVPGAGTTTPPPAAAGAATTPAATVVTPAQISSYIARAIRTPSVSLDAVKAALVRSGADPAAVDAEIARQQGAAGPSVPVTP